MQEIVFDAARPVAPGAKIKAQLNSAWVNLGRPSWWRLIAAWKGEAGSWSATAAYDFEQRHSELKTRRAARIRAIDLAHAAKWEAMATLLEGENAELHRSDIEVYRTLARAARALDRSRHLDLTLRKGT
jgi:hypothetical protein